MEGFSTSHCVRSSPTLSKRLRRGRPGQNLQRHKWECWPTSATQLLANHTTWPLQQLAATVPTPGTLCQPCLWLPLCFKDVLLLAKTSWSLRRITLRLPPHGDSAGSLNACDRPQLMQAHSSKTRCCFIAAECARKRPYCLATDDSLGRWWCSTAHMTVCPARAPLLSRTRSGPVS